MDWHIERFLNRLSFLLATIATIALLHLFFTHSTSCNPGPHHLHTHTHTHTHTLTLTLTLAHTPFPSSSCDPSLPSRDLLTPDKRFRKLASSSSFKKRAASFSSLFLSLRLLRLLTNSSRVLCAPSGAGHDAFALRGSGVADVTAVDLVDFPPLVKRSDLHNLPFFDGVFDLVFSAGLDVALFPRRFAEEMERTVREGGAVAVVVEEADGVEGLFRRSRVLEVRNVSLDGTGMLSLIVMSKVGNSSSKQ